MCWGKRPETALLPEEAEIVWGEKFVGIFGMPSFILLCAGAVVISAKDTNMMIRKAGSVLGVKLDTVEVVAKRGTLAKALVIMKKPSHPLIKTLQRRTLRGRLLLPRCRKQCFCRSLGQQHSECTTLHFNPSLYPCITVHLCFIYLCTGHNMTTVTTPSVDNNLYVDNTAYITTTL